MEYLLFFTCGYMKKRTSHAFESMSNEGEMKWYLFGAYSIPRLWMRLQFGLKLAWIDLENVSHCFLIMFLEVKDININHVGNCCDHVHGEGSFNKFKIVLNKMFYAPKSQRNVLKELVHYSWLHNKFPMNELRLILQIFIMCMWDNQHNHPHCLWACVNTVKSTIGFINKKCLVLESN